MAKLIILRGPSGSGKSSVAKKLREKIKSKTALVEHDYLRRIILKEEDIPNGINSHLIFKVTEFALNNGYNVILEGIFFTKHYRQMLDKILEFHPEGNYIYYFDVPLKETLKRHQSKDIAEDFGEKEMGSWYVGKDVLNLGGETIISEESSLDETINKILKDTDL